MSQSATSPQGVLRAPRVLFDLKCLLLALAGFVVLYLVNLGLEKWFGQGNPIGQMVTLLATEIGRVAFLGDGFRRAMDGVWGLQPHALNWWQGLVTAFLFFATWAVFGGALLRTCALRLTRDEPISLSQALVFSGRNLRAFLIAPVLVAVVAGFFLVCIAAAGFVISLPFIGSWILVLLLWPLSLLAALLAILTLVAGLFGLPLMWAGIAFERNGALEALSRAFSYIFARPLQFFFGYLLIFVFMSVVILVGDSFEDTAKESVRVWGVRESFKDIVAYRIPDNVGALEPALRRTMEQRTRGIADLDNIRHAGVKDYVAFAWMWLFLSLFLLAFKAYALYVFLGGTASLYLILRRDVDGTDEEEVYLPDEEVSVPTPAEQPRWVGGEKPADPGPGGAGASPGDPKQ
ncbi:MAG: hypothetical protein ACT4PV_05575 [Planctomycetaceae bacterium]